MDEVLPTLCLHLVSLLAGTPTDHLAYANGLELFVNNAVLPLGVLRPSQHRWLLLAWASMEAKPIGLPKRKDGKKKSTSSGYAYEANGASAQNRRVLINKSSTWVCRFLGRERTKSFGGESLNRRCSVSRRTPRSCTNA
ncbi:hypothetical protein FGIG_04226 [Fasciola gigantica]|uniref:Uncharacterized protein n=1 Tax=Fasciola gigantica TaxID=46835 RepID=A0A504YJ56_FASGI|nr:hypothetical protein FGIG_04226 [Fasciola gigantica]